jgi:photosystem II stability/assembly factor-like uncharacterized protein
MKRALVLGLVFACGGKTPAVTVKPPPADVTLVATGDWQLSPSEPFRGKQDDIAFASPKRGFYGNGDGKIFRTDDGGATWKMVLEQKGTFVRAMGFLDDKRGFAGNLGPDAFPGVTDTQLLYRTDDGGDTWKPVVLPDLEGARGVCAIDILAVDAVNAGHPLHKELVHVGGRVGGPAALFRSDDGGGTWARLKLPPQIAMILDVKFLDPSLGFVFAGSDPDVAKSHGLIARTQDAGRTWQVVYESQRPFELMWKGAFPSRLVGYATLQNYSADAAAPHPKRYVVKTEDGGATWKELVMVDDVNVRELGIGFVDDKHGWVGAIPNGFETLDGGATWKAVESMPKATNKIRVVRDGDRAEVWAIGLDVRHLSLAPAR